MPCLTWPSRQSCRMLNAFLQGVILPCEHPQCERILAACKLHKSSGVLKTVNLIIGSNDCRTSRQQPALQISLYLLLLERCIMWFSWTCLAPYLSLRFGLELLLRIAAHKWQFFFGVDLRDKTFQEQAPAYFYLFLNSRASHSMVLIFSRRESRENWAVEGAGQPWPFLVAKRTSCQGDL